MKRLIQVLSLGLLVSLSTCGLTDEKLPYIGEPETTTKIVDEKEVTQREYPAIPAFSFTNQYGKTISQRDFNGKIYVTDFFRFGGPIYDLPDHLPHHESDRRSERTC
ncbi:hypothetical protein [Spirosoma pollinicola]|uniref:hypothetical protein n=1 Tax=Spirosoma pollinicola TaxID=2057025 RepID=UPI0026D8DD6D|nr:hypothetical protein [Spirosoma pollinicola]